MISRLLASCFHCVLSFLWKQLASFFLLTVRAMKSKPQSFKTAYERFICAAKKRQDASQLTRREMQKLKSKSSLEVHHIIPRSLGGTDKLANLVLLTHADHIYAHLLLNLALAQEDKQEWLAKLTYRTVPPKLLMKLLKSRKNALRGLKIDMFIAGKKHPPTTMSITDAAKICCAVARLDFSDQSLLSKMAAEVLSTAIYSSRKLGYRLKIYFG